MLRAITLTSSLLVGILVGTAPAAPWAQAAPQQAMAYRSCTYPKSTTKSRPKVNARSWAQQGVASGVLGIDVSRWQHPRTARYPMGKPIDFGVLRQAYGLDFVIVKASDGRNADKGRHRYLFARDRAAARRQGIVVGAYHYAVPGALGGGAMSSAANRRNDALLQARLAVRNARGAPIGDLPLTLDLEERPCGWTWVQVAQWAKVFVLEAQRLTGRKPIIYANGYMIGKLQAAGSVGIDWSAYPLWVARWGPKLGTSPGTVPFWGSQWTIWQFTSDGRLRGIPTGRTDLNVFNGSNADLMRMANGS